MVKLRLRATLTKRGALTRPRFSSGEARARVDQRRQGGPLSEIKGLPDYVKLEGEKAVKAVPL